MKRHVFLLVTLFTMSTVAAQQQPIISPKDSIPSVIERVTGKENKGFSAHMNLQLYTSCAASFTENELDEVAFKLNRFKLEISTGSSLTISGNLLINTATPLLWIICPLP